MRAIALPALINCSATLPLKKSRRRLIKKDSERTVPENFDTIHRFLRFLSGTMTVIPVMISVEWNMLISKI